MKNKLNELSSILDELYNDCDTEKEVNDLRIELNAKNNYFAESRLEEVIELKEEQ